LFDHFKAEFKRWSGKDTRRTFARFSRWVTPRLQEHGLDACKDVVAFVFRSDNYLAKNLRDGGHAVGETPWRPSKFETYLDLAGLPAADAPIPQHSSDWVPFPGAPGRKVHRDTDGTWLPNSSNLLDPAFPWRAVLRDVMAGILRRRDAGERVDKYVPEPFLAALRECSHPARPEQQIHLSNILGRLVDEIEGAQ